MEKLYINGKLEKSIMSYCTLNDIEDIEGFVNDCTLKGFNIIKFGTSPMDNIERENKGIKDFNYEKKRIERKEINSCGKDKVEPRIEEINEGNSQEEGNEEKEQIIPIKEKKVSIRKIKVIKK